MKFKVTFIDFDFEVEDDNYPTLGYQEEVIAETMLTVWDADDEDDLLEEITCATGWCIKSIDYVHVLS
jgi:hypothetical protein